MEKKIEVTPKSVYQCGMNDSYYMRPPMPHYYSGMVRMNLSDRHSDLYKAYMNGYEENEKNGHYKDFS